jgi:hypothetical protein
MSPKSAESLHICGLVRKNGQMRHGKPRDDVFWARVSTAACGRTNR